jgi:hypothetical protein
MQPSTVGRRHGDNANNSSGEKRMKIKTVIFWMLALTLTLTGCGIAEDQIGTAVSEPQATITNVVQAEVEEEAAEERMEFEADVESADDGISLSQAGSAPPQIGRATPPPICPLRTPAPTPFLIPLTTT